MFSSSGTSALAVCFCSSCSLFCKHRRTHYWTYWNGDNGKTDSMSPLNSCCLHAWGLTCCWWWAGWRGRNNDPMNNCKERHLTPGTFFKDKNTICSFFFFFFFLSRAVCRMHEWLTPGRLTLKFSWINYRAFGPGEQYYSLPRTQTREDSDTCMQMWDEC